MTLVKLLQEPEELPCKAFCIVDFFPTGHDLERILHHINGKRPSIKTIRDEDLAREGEEGSTQSLLAALKRLWGRQGGFSFPATLVFPHSLEDLSEGKENWTALESIARATL